MPRLAIATIVACVGPSIQVVGAEEPRIALPGRCVRPPTVRHEVVVSSSSMGWDGHSHGASTRVIKTARMLDVDRDGVDDVFVPIPPRKGACPDALSYRVYVMRGRCGHVLGVVGPGKLARDAATVPVDASGFRPITLETVTSKYGDRELEETTTSRAFAVRSGKYVEVSKQARGGECPHCSIRTCTSPH